MHEQACYTSQQISLIDSPGKLIHENEGKRGQFERDYQYVS